MSKKFFAIDNNLKPGQIMFIDQLKESDSHDTEAMKYGCSQTHQLRRQLNEQGTLVDNLAEKVLKMKMNQVQEELVQS